MTTFRQCLHILFLPILFASCQKDINPKPESRILFSVDLDNSKFNSDIYADAYIAAYTSEGKLINYGNLTDSTKWELKGECKDDKFDILYYEIVQQNMLTIYQFKNVKVGQIFNDTQKVEIDPYAGQYFKITLKVEDFGNHYGNSTAMTNFELYPHSFTRGASYSGEFEWNTIEGSNGYKNAYIELDPKYQGTELLIFERGTNLPFVYYLDIPATNLQEGDTITLNKSDFKAAELKSTQVNSKDNEFDNMFLYVYNSINGKRDLISSFDQVIPNASGTKSIKHIETELLPISYWTFKYVTSTPGSTSYIIRSTEELPSTIEIKELSGHKISGSGNQFNFTHSKIFPDKNIARSTLQFAKGYCLGISYNLYFEGSETLGNLTIQPFEILPEILTKYPEIAETNKSDWSVYQYSQTYTDMPNSSALEFLKNSLLKWSNNSSSTADYTNEMYIINL